MINKKNIETPKPKSIPDKEKKNDNSVSELQRQLREEKLRNKELNNEIKKLNSIIKQLKQENENKETESQDKINQLKEKINELEEELQDYIFQINNLNKNQSQVSSIKKGEKVFSVLFMTQGNQDIFNYAMACKNTDLFIRLEEKLYMDYPKYRKYDTYFMVNARKIFRFKTIDENKIKKNDIISIFINDS